MVRTACASICFLNSGLWGSDGYPTSVLKLGLAYPGCPTRRRCVLGPTLLHRPLCEPSTWSPHWPTIDLKTSRHNFPTSIPSTQMPTAQKESEVQVQYVNAVQDLLAELRPGAPFDARASFQAFGERQFGARFAGVAYCCELPGAIPPRWEAALELKAHKPANTPRES